MGDLPVPEEIVCSEQIFDLSFHPTANVLATGLIDGTVDVWSYGLNDSNKLLIKNSFHTSSCRGALFAMSGELLFTISSDRSFQGVNGVGQQVFVNPLAHDEPINKLTIVSEAVIATGDDSGEIKLWDIRTPGTEIAKWHLHEDFVSGLCFHEESNTLLSVSGDATLCVYDVRSSKNNTRSDDQESELHCVQVIKHGRKVVCGSQDGVIQVFSWGRWGDCSDRYPGHPQTVDCMLKIDERTVITGSSDGLIRVVQILPNDVIGVIGDHDGFPVEGLAMSCDRRLLGSFAHDEVVRFWDVAQFADDIDDEEDDCEEEQQHGNVSGTVPRRKASKGVNAKSSGGDVDSSDDEEEDDGVEWEDCGDDEDEEDDVEQEGNVAAMAVEDASSSDASDGDDSSDDERQDRPAGRRLLTKSEKFFADL